MKKFFLTLTLVFGLCFAFTGCKKNNSASFVPSFRFNDDEEVVLSVVGDLKNFEALEAVIYDFNQYYPNCRVTYSYLPGYDSSVITKLKNAGDLDIFLVRQSFRSHPAVQEYSLNMEYSTVDLSGINPGLLKGSYSNGKLGQLPLWVEGIGFMVNDDLLAAYGVKYPENYNELLEACRVFIRNEITPICGSKYYCFDGLISNSFFVNWSKSGNTDYDPILRDYMLKVQEMRSMGCFDLKTINSLSDPYDQTIMKFFEGNIPFMVVSYETFSGTKKRESRSQYYSEHPFKYSMRLIPLDNHSPSSFFNTSRGLCIYKNSANLEWAKEFVRFMYSKEELDKFSRLKEVPSVSSGQVTDEKYKNVYTVPEYTATIGDSSAIRDDFISRLRKIMFRFVNENLTVDQVLDQLKVYPPATVE